MQALGSRSSSFEVGVSGPGDQIRHRLAADVRIEALWYHCTVEKDVCPVSTSTVRSSRRLPSAHVLGSIISEPVDRTHMRMIVTGNAGFIGGHLIRTLEAEGADVVGVDLKEGKDIRDTELMKRVFAGATYVFHLAALPRVPYSIEHPRETHDHNVDGTLSVLLAAHHAGVKRVIYSASSSAYGNSPVLPLTEELPAHPISPYGL